MQLCKVRRPHKAFDNFALLVDDKSGGSEFDVAPFASHYTRVVNGHPKGQLSRLGEIDHITGRVVAHRHSQGDIAAVFVLVVSGHQFRHLSHTGGATGGPKVHQSYFSLQLLCAHGAAVEQNEGRFRRTLTRAPPQGQQQAEHESPIQHSTAHRPQIQGSNQMVLHRRKFNTFAMSSGILAIVPAHAFSLADLSAGDASQGLKLALEKGASAAISLLGVEGGFMGNDKVRIGLPDALSKGARMLKTLGMGQQLDALTLQMNRAAEQAVPLAQKALVQSIQTMSVQDAKGILKGGDTAVTQFFVEKTRAPLSAEFLPQVKQVLGQLGVVEQFNAVAGKLSSMGLVSKDKALLENHVTGKTLDGLYFMIGEEEKKIRQNPAQAGSALLSKVFGTLR